MVASSVRRNNYYVFVVSALTLIGDILFQNKENKNGSLNIGLFSIFHADVLSL